MIPNDETSDGTGPVRAWVDISSRPTAAAVDRNIYGHFLESAFFNNIESGIFDEQNRLSIPDPGPLQGCRRDVLDTCRDLGVSVLRWPGGNFTSPYWWQDGIGPRGDRPRRLELAWGSEESNRFGTPEFLAWCAAVGAAPYLAHHCRNVDDAVRWVEYTNYAGSTEYAKRRAADGHPDPYPVRYWGLGNEVYGSWQMGHRSAEQYVADAREHAQFMRAVDPDLSFIACGWEQEDWTEKIVSGLGDRADYVSLHLYGISRQLGQPTVTEYDAVVAQPLFFESTIVDYSQRISAAAQRRGYDRAPAIAMDEWNIRHLEPVTWPTSEPGADGGIAERELAGLPDTGALRVNRHSPRTLADALFYAGVFHVLHRAAQLDAPVAMANTVNLVNANGLVNVRPGGLVRTPTYYVWDLYQNHVGPVPTSSRVSAPADSRDVRQGADKIAADGTFLTRPAAVSLLDVSTSLSLDHSTLSVVAINRSASDHLVTKLSLDANVEALPHRARMLTIGADVGDLFATNSISQPDTVVLGDEQEVRLDHGRYAFPAHSITALTFDLR